MKEFMPQDHLVHLHCFTDGPDDAKRFLEAFPNLYIGFTGVVTYASAKQVVEAAKVTPLNRILLETDGPYMPPEPVARGKACHPGHIPLIAKKLAEIQGVSYEDIMRAARDNTRNIYGV
jgi:TatD DNase family protein